MKWIVPAVVVVFLVFPLESSAQPPLIISDFDSFASRLQSLVETTDRDGFLALLTPGADLEAAREFALDVLHPDVDRSVVLPRFLIPAEDERGTHELTVEVFTETGDQGRLQTWRMELIASESAFAVPNDVSLVASRGTPGWIVADYEAMDGIDALHHLRLNPDKQFDATNLVVVGEDMTLRMSSGAAFVVEVDAGVTGLVLVGDGMMTFDPAPEAERRQVQIFAGSETLEAEFTRAFVRVNPAMFRSRVSPTTLTETAVDKGDFKEALELFDEVAGQAYSVDLRDYSDRTWWLIPTVGHFRADVSTRRYGMLAYTQAKNQPEDIALYQTEPKDRIVSLYTSASQRAVQGKYYDDQDVVAYDILDYDIVASFEPAGVRQESLKARAQLEGCFIDGTARLAVRVTDVNFNNLTLQLAHELTVHSVTSRELGPLLFFRMSGRDNILISLPSTAHIGTEFSLVVEYSGLLQAQEPDENWIGRSRRLYDRTPIFGVGERRYIYSRRTAWYPQSPVTDFATATMELTVPADYGVIASGETEQGNPPLSPLDEETRAKSYRFTTLQPAKSLSAVISRFWPHETPAQEITVDATVSRPQIRSGVIYDQLTLSVETNPRSREQLGEYLRRAKDILKFYGSLVGDLPYPALTLALTDSILPGGYSPAYFAILNQPLPLDPGTMWSWGDDPVAFSEIDDFFLAHEVAHQWWGQAVGWKNYHEQWLSEALAQYFAALYIQEDQGEEAFRDILGQMRKWSLRLSEEGPVYLGFRLGHIDGDPRVYRALVYNKGAMVLHMLRRLIGDEAFFNGLRRYYGEMRFKTAGTDDLIRAFETESVRSLEDFFERWIHESDLPELRFDYRTEAGLPGSQSATDVVLRFEQTGQVFEVPVTVTLKYRSGKTETTVVQVAEQFTEIRVPLKGQLRDIDVNEDEAALGEIRQ